MFYCDMRKFGIYNLTRWEDASLSVLASAKVRKDWTEKLSKHMNEHNLEDIEFRSKITFKEDTRVFFKMLLESKSKSLLDWAGKILGIPSATEV
ncbi:hypothetical protein LCGC14_0932840 [marine sediment metagenome]|uniref:Uncharacterized protein n=1 Tax=marine sediment metagenome TaxID=412755 RepID=A0A0F9P8H3_9ZZZZ